MELENPQKSHGNFEMVMENVGNVGKFTLGLGQRLLPFCLCSKVLQQYMQLGPLPLEEGPRNTSKLSALTSSVI